MVALLMCFFPNPSVFQWLLMVVIYSIFNDQSCLQKLLVFNIIYMCLCQCISCHVCVPLVGSHLSEWGNLNLFGLTIQTSLHNCACQILIWSLISFVILLYVSWSFKLKTSIVGLGNEANEKLFANNFNARSTWTMWSTSNILSKQHDVYGAFGELKSGFVKVHT